MIKPFMKMLLYFRKSLFFILILVFSSCNQDEIEETGVPLRISSVVFSNVSLRATLAEGSLGIFRLTGSNYSGTQSNVKYDYKSGSSSWEAASGTNQILLTKNNINIRAYYPYSSDAEYNTGTGVALTSQLYDAGKDLCYQKANVSVNSENNVNLTLDHAYCLVKFVITRDASYDKTCKISLINIGSAVNGTIKTSTLSLKDGTYGAGTTGTVTIDPGITGISLGGSVTKSALMVPVTSITGDLALKLTVDDKEMSTSVSNASFPSLVAGKINTISVSVNGIKDLNVTGVTSTDWANQAVTNPAIAELGSMVESNSYIVQPGAKVLIPVSRVSAAWTQVNGTAYTLPSAWTAGLLWTTNSVGLAATGSVASIAINRNVGYIEVTAGSAEGNSVIALYDNDGTTIRWSWHIWVTNYNPNTLTSGTVYTFNGRTWMDRNLGATTTTAKNVTTFGLLYQWGRKDPFPGSKDISANNDLIIYTESGYVSSINKTSVTAVSNLSNTILEPLTFFKGVDANSYDWYSETPGTQNHLLWGGASATTPLAKTLFDPCPVGWRVPAWSDNKSPWDAFNLTTFPFYVPGNWSSSYGRVYTSANSTYYPAAGYRTATSGDLTSVSSGSGNWSATSSGSNGYSMDFTSSVVSNSSYYNRANGFSVRCVKE